MDSRLIKAVKEAEGNIYMGISLKDGAIVFSWTLLCLFLVNTSGSFLYDCVLGGIYYSASIAIYLYLFKGVRGYLSFPSENKKMPVFIGHKLDTLFTYPIILMALIGILSGLVSAAGFAPASPGSIGKEGGSVWTTAARFMLLPLLAFSEELFNLLIVSFIYKFLKLRGHYRMIASVIFAAIVFGVLHTFGQGPEAAVHIGVAYAPVFFATLCTGNIWISFLAHFYNDLLSLTKAYSSGLHLVLTAAVSLIPAVWAVSTMLKRTR